MGPHSTNEHSGDSMPRHNPPAFAERFVSQHQAEHYRDRFRKGRRARTDQLEKNTLRQMGELIGRVPVALDLPCGTGRLSRTLLEFSDDIILGDSSSSMLEVARQDLPDPRVNCQLMDAENISLPDASVDLVFCHRFLYHVAGSLRRTRMLSEFVRVTRKYIILSYYPPGLLNRWRGLRRHLLRQSESQEFRPSADQYCEEIRSAGLRFVHAATMRHFPVAGTFFLLQRD